MSDRLALANAIEDAGIERAKAERVASVIVDLVHDSVATKADVQALGGELRAEIAATRSELKAELATQINGVRGLLASETARLDARIERLDGTVKAQQRDHAAPGHADGGADWDHPGRAALPAAAGPRLSEPQSCPSVVSSAASIRRTGAS